MYFYTLPTFKLWGKLWGERGVLKTAQCAVLPREVSKRIHPAVAVTEHGDVLTPCEKMWG